MKELAVNALDAAVRRGISYADVRFIETEDRHVSTKNGKIGELSNSVSVGLGIRVLDRGSWGFAATDNLTADGIETAAKLAVEIARASAVAKKHDVTLALKTIFTIHNIAYQGVFPALTFARTNLPDELYHIDGLE